MTSDKYQEARRTLRFPNTMVLALELRKKEEVVIFFPFIFRSGSVRDDGTERYYNVCINIRRVRGLTLIGVGQMTAETENQQKLDDQQHCRPNHLSRNIVSYERQRGTENTERVI